MVDIFSRSFAEQIKEVTADNSELSVAYGKVKGHLTKYAKERGKKFEELLLIEVTSLGEKLNENLVKFINSLKKAKCKNNLSSEYKSGIRSIIKRLVKEIITKTDLRDKTNSNNESLIPADIPKWMNNILGYISRGGAPRYRLGDPRRQELPLSEKSQKLLLILNQVAQKHHLNSIELLLVDYKKECYSEIRKNYYGQQRKELKDQINQLQKNLGLETAKEPIGHLKFEFWSPTAKKQWEAFLSLVRQGVSANSFLAQQEKIYKVKLNKLKKRTIQNYFYALQIGLAHSKLPEGDWSFKDLLDINTVTIELPDGRPHPYLYNEVIEDYRKREQERESPAKRKGFDSTQFSHFRSALIALANYNGLAYLVPGFRKAYTVIVDKESRELRKSIKDKLYTITEIDAHFEPLEEKFLLIIQGRLFDPESGIDPQEADKAMRFCQFYIMFLVMRFLGLRQINVRNFRLMKNPENRERPEGNIGFLKNGNVVIHFEKDEMKNGRILHFELNPKKMGETHGYLIRGLKKYFRNIYPYILSHSDSTLDKQFFAHKVPGKNKYTQLPDEESAFGSIFKSMTQEFLTFEGLNAENYLPLNPHFLRRVCINWLANILRMPIEGVAYYVADTLKTIVDEYLDKDRIHDPSGFIEEINRKLENEKATLKEAEMAQRYLELWNREKVLWEEQKAKYEAQILELKLSHEKDSEFKNRQITENRQQLAYFQKQNVNQQLQIENLLTQNSNLVEQNAVLNQLLRDNSSGREVINM